MVGISLLFLSICDPVDISINISINRHCQPLKSSRHIRTVPSFIATQIPQPG